MSRVNIQTISLFIIIISDLFSGSCKLSSEHVETNDDVVQKIGISEKKYCTEQILVACNAQYKSVQGIFYGYEFVDNKWEVTLDSIACSFGINGVAEMDRKIEGDGKTPSGIFEVGVAFGYKNDIDTDVEFIELTDKHYWVSDTSSQMYNKLVYAKPNGMNAEKMYRNDHLYKYGIIIEYNTKNIVKGKGSAIFMHIERKPGAPTSGCIAVSENNMKRLLQWIKPQKRPIIIVDQCKIVELRMEGM